MTLLVINRQSRHRVSRSKLKRVAALTLRAVGRTRSRVNIVLVSDRSIRSLNRKYHARDRVTDCLAFGYKRAGKKGLPKAAGPGALLGDVVISLDRARVNARVWNEPFQREVWRYAIHSILHLVGYRDDTPRARKRMFQRQEEILKLAVKAIQK